MLLSPSSDFFSFSYFILFLNFHLVLHYIHLLLLCWSIFYLLQVCFQLLVNTNTCVLTHVRLFVTLWTVARQAPLSTEFSRQEYWSGLLFPSPRDPFCRDCRHILYCLSHQGILVSKWKMKQVNDITEFNRQIILRRNIWSMILKILKISESVTKYRMSVVLRQTEFVGWIVLSE